MKKILGTIFVIAFMTGMLFTGLGCTPKEEAAGDGNGNGSPIPTAEDQEKKLEEVTE